MKSDKLQTQFSVPSVGAVSDRARFIIQAKAD
jgi:hypothetical protein